MSDQTIICTKCGEAIELTEALTDKINKDIRLELENDYKKKLESERKSFEDSAREKAEKELKIELEDLNEQLKEKSTMVDELQKEELNLRKKGRELEQAKKDVDLEVARKIDIERTQIAKDIESEYEEKHLLEDRAKDKKLEDLMKKLEEARRSAKQGSQQLQGEVAELEIEERLSNEFPIDRIEPVPTGVRGADVIQTVKNETLSECGKIIWEFKQTKSWAKAWIPKLKDDQREIKADIAVIVSQALPDGVETIKQIDGVWVVGYKFAIGLASALRDSLIRVSASKSSEIGKNQKIEFLYDYLSGAEFKQRVEAMVEAFGAMRTNLDKEKAAMSRIWAKRETEIGRYMKAVSGMYGDMEGIVGLTLPAIRQLQLTDGESGEEYLSSRSDLVP